MRITLAQPSVITTLTLKGNAESLMNGMEENAAKFPGKILEVQRALEDDDHVAVHSHVRLKPDERGFALVHIFRFHNDRIVELWDLGQPVPEDSPNEY
jgi:predicted SnoaL-like aldol condensation-catalyzing enzyme